MKNGILALLTGVAVSGCMVFHVTLVAPLDESRVEKVSVPPKVRLSGFAEEEDLTPLCGGRPLVYVKFVLNAPKEVWCQLPDVAPASTDGTRGSALQAP